MIMLGSVAAVVGYFVGLVGGVRSLYTWGRDWRKDRGYHEWLADIESRLRARKDALSIAIEEDQIEHALRAQREGRLAVSVGYLLVDFAGNEIRKVSNARIWWIG